MMRQFALSFDPESSSSPAGLPEPESIVAGLNEAQQQAVTALEGPVLIVAGPGSGKTRTLTHRIAYLLATGRAKPYQVLALTFTNKAAREMQERIRHLVGPQAARGITMGTFHSVFARILRIEGEALGYSRDFSIYDSDDSERILRSLMERFRIDSKQFSVRALRGLISSAKNAMVSPHDYGRMVASPIQEKAALVYPAYEETLSRSNAMDFDDLLLKPIALFQGHPEVLKKYQQKWQFLHIDEYQDTNHAQYTIAKMLAAAHRNLCVVGDDAQSIYAFRGADIANILSFQRDYKDAKTIRLEQNYRSTQKILALAESIIKQNRDQLEKHLWTDNTEGNFVLLMEALSEKDEAQKIERTIRELQTRAGHPYRDFAVLYRTNAQSRSIEDALRRASIPYRLIGGVSFYSRKEIKDALAYLRLMVNPHDAASLRRVINYPTRGIGDKTVEMLALFARERGYTLWQALDHLDESELAGRASGSVQKFHFLINQHAAQLATRPADEVARDLLQEAGLFSAFKQEQTLESQARWENVQELLNALAEHVQAAEGNDLSTFLQEVTLLTDADRADDGEVNRVTLMTLHASKGLEFPAVFVTGMEEGLFPLAKAAQDPRELEEERRLFYVGVTRAQEHLFLTHARTRFRYGQHESSLRSRFLDEVDTSVIRTESGRALEQKSDRFTMQPAAPAGRTITYDGVDPHYYRTPVGGARKGGSGRGGRDDDDNRVVYDEGEAQIVPGVAVEHQQFGRGKVLALEGRGDMAKATVFFHDHGQKKLVLKFARLRRLG